MIIWQIFQSMCTGPKHVSLPFFLAADIYTLRAKSALYDIVSSGLSKDQRTSV